MSNVSKSLCISATAEGASNPLPPATSYALGIFAGACLAISVVRFWKRVGGKACKRKGDEKLIHPVSPALYRKREFLSRVGDSYGYSRSPCGFIDSWRKKEHPALIGPLDTSLSFDTHADESEVYLDYAGAALPTLSQLKSIQKSAEQVLANPHSTGPGASRTKLHVEKAKKLVLDHFCCHPGRLYGIKEEDQTSDTHPGYEIIFTSGATDSMRMVADRFPWFCCDKCSRKSVLVYALNSHTSMVGMRGPVLSAGATFLCQSLSSLTQASAETINQWVEDADAAPFETCKCHGKSVYNLLALSAECNFGGTRADVKSVVSAVRAASSLGSNDRWCTIVDLAKAASTGPVNLRELDPDFACVSFYKMFGEPTGLGALFVKRTAVDILMGPTNLSSDRRESERRTAALNPPQHYFGGGSVDAVLPRINFMVPKSEPSLLMSLVNGSVHFRGIASLLHGFSELERVGGMTMIYRHATSLSAELSRRLKIMKHANGKPAIVIYGAWSEHPKRRHQERPGPTVAFNVLRSDGSFVGYNEVSKLAALNRPPLQLRTGCFCNPGACQEALGLSDDQVQENYLAAGHVCGDQIDIVNNKPTGAVRVSFGKDSLWEDLDALELFLEKMFVNNDDESSELSEWKGKSGKVEAEPTSMELSELYIFPIKSCAAQRVKKWKMTRCGRLPFDREFALVDSSGHAMRLQAYPKMAFLTPTVDIELKTLTVTAAGQKDLVLDLECDQGANGTSVVKVCGNRCGGKLWGDASVSEWFSSFLGVQCWLARHSGGNYEVPQPTNGATPGRVTMQSPFSPRHRDVAFANEQPLLLISESSVFALNEILSLQDQRGVSTRHFRPNFVVKSSAGAGGGVMGTNPEDHWSELAVRKKNVKFSAVGQCARCSMVDVDPRSGMKGNTLRVLADYRRRHGQITFGIFLRGDPQIAKDGDAAEEVLLEEGDIFNCL